MAKKARVANPARRTNSSSFFIHRSISGSGFLSLQNKLPAHASQISHEFKSCTHVLSVVAEIRAGSAKIEAKMRASCTFVCHSVSANCWLGCAIVLASSRNFVTGVPTANSVFIPKRSLICFLKRGEERRLICATISWACLVISSILNTPETAGARCVRGECFFKFLRVKIGPQHRCKIKLAVCGLPK